MTKTTIATARSNLYHLAEFAFPIFDLNFNHDYFFVKDCDKIAVIFSHLNRLSPSLLLALLHLFIVTFYLHLHIFIVTFVKYRC
jgi:hypothetical protein